MNMNMNKRYIKTLTEKTLVSSIDTLLKRVSWSNTKKCVGDRGPYSQTRFVGSTPINGLLE